MIKTGKINLKKYDQAFRQRIHNMILKYYNTVHRKNEKFVPGTSRINYAGRVYDAEEIRALVDSCLDFWLTAGRFAHQFEKGLADFLGAQYCLLTNSGSSANLLAIAALTSYKLGDLRVKEGDEVITVAAGFPTTINPIIQNRLTPVFVDIELDTYNIDTDLIEKAISRRTKVIFLAHSLGIPFNLDKILKIAQKYNLWVIEDNCDALGAKYNLAREYRLIKGKSCKGEGHTGTFGHIGTSSFYPPHHITTGEGGAVYTQDIDLYRILLSFRDWGRDCWCDSGKDNTCGRRFDWKLGNLPKGYDHKFIYSHLGYNLKITDMQASIGTAQLKKLPEFIKIRRKNWQMLYEGLKDLDDIFILPKYLVGSQPSPFGFVLTLREKAGFIREDIIRFLEKNNIQTRMVFAGNMLRQPALLNTGAKYRIYGRLKNTDIVMNRTFWIGVYPGLNKNMIGYMIKKIREFVKRDKK
jgi:CDP-6-deoxy-D-xylo-4-hexulose-3-dehydrase